MNVLSLTCSTGINRCDFIKEEDSFLKSLALYIRLSSAGKKMESGKACEMLRVKF